ncbi:MAG: hypothetical protein HXX13_13385 [Bacteroidetes bacterium]|nr:hypothetical protein [Bacteroidota bacterium]
MKSPFIFSYHKEVQDILDEILIDNFSKVFEESYCDNISKLDSNTLLVTNEYFNIRPTLNFNIWNGIGTAKLHLDRNQDDIRQIHYKVDYTRSAVLFITTCIGFFILLTIYSPDKKENLNVLIPLLFIFIAFINTLILYLRHRSMFLNAIKRRPDNIGNYNWTEILERKSNKELNEIILGKAQLPNSISSLAKHELERRIIKKE